MRFWTTIGRAILLRCPVCGRGRLFRGFLRIHPACSECRHSFQPEAGYYVGAMYLNYLTTAVLGLTVTLLLLPAVELNLLVPLAIAYALMFPLAFHRHARSLWLGVETYVTSRGRKDPPNSSPPDSPGGIVTPSQDGDDS